MNASMVEVQRLKGKEKSQALREVRCRTCTSWGRVSFLFLQNWIKEVTWPLCWCCCSGYENTNWEAVKGWSRKGSEGVAVVMRTGGSLNQPTGKGSGDNWSCLRCILKVLMRDTSIDWKLAQKKGGSRMIPGVWGTGNQNQRRYCSLRGLSQRRGFGEEAFCPLVYPESDGDKVKSRISDLEFA